MGILVYSLNFQNTGSEKKIMAGSDCHRDFQSIALPAAHP